MHRDNIVLRNFGKLAVIWLISLLMVLLSYTYTRSIVEGGLLSLVRQTLRVEEESIEGIFRESSAMLLGAALSVQNHMEGRRSKEEIQHYMDMLSFWFMGNKGPVESFLYLYAYVNGVFWGGGGWLPPIGFVAEGRPWYQVVRDLEPGHVAISDVYWDVRTSERVISIVTPIPSGDGVSPGVISLDIDLKKILDGVRGMSFIEGGYGILLDRECRLIAHPDASLISKSMADVSPVHARVVEQLRAGIPDLLTVEMLNNSGKSMIVIFKQMRNGWFIGLATPLISYYRDVYILALILGMIGLTLALTVSIFIIRLSKEKQRADAENRSKSSFLARMSHEIRTPMNAILGMAELISHQNISHEIVDYITVINQSGASLLSIINDILDFSKIESGNLRLDSRAYFLSSLVNEVINLMRVRISDNKSIDFFVYIDCGIPMQLAGDDLRIRQILLNLLGNAVKYVNEGFVSLDIRRGKKEIPGGVQLLFQVKDTGIGIREEDLDKLFIEFSRLDHVRRQRVEGSGLGLAITNSFCRMMGGDVSVVSEYGKGSTFTAVICQEVKDPEPLAWVKDADRKTVLLYEDRPLYKLSVQCALHDLGVRVENAENLLEFTRKIEDKEYQFAFTSSRFLMDCIGVFGERGLPPALVFMMEIGDTLPFIGIRHVMMPVHALALADVLNDSPLDSSSREGRQLPFSAPTATVLAVDDVPTNLRVIKELLARYSIVAHTCLSGAEAVASVRQERYDMVFMDHMMPEMDGIETMRAIRRLADSDGYFQNLPIVALTANVIFGQREIFLQKGFDDFLSKPIEMQKLDHILRCWIPVEKQVEASARQGEYSGSDEMMQLYIPGVDTAAGLKNAGGAVATYMDILMDFQRDAHKKLYQIKSALETEDIDMYVILVHAIKGASRVIGAYDFADFAEKLEKAAVAGDTALVHAETDLLLYNMNALADRVGKALLLRRKNNGEEKGACPDIRSLKLDLLKEALLKMDITTVNNLLQVYSGMGMEGWVKELISEIELYILDFEYDKAVEKIDCYL
ncbi:MAG: response regulator [Desulfovibrio sp.]|jgi:signal transduction histidine kinase/CheY-like chemotaxis protein|nr:response regulator [Desulfovibrio sp.]